MHRLRLRPWRAGGFKTVLLRETGVSIRTLPLTFFSTARDGPNQLEAGKKRAELKQQQQAELEKPQDIQQQQVDASRSSFSRACTSCRNILHPSGTSEQTRHPQTRAASPISAPKSAAFQPNATQNEQHTVESDSLILGHDDSVVSMSHALNYKHTLDDIMEADRGLLMDPEVGFPEHIRINPTGMLSPIQCSLSIPAKSNDTESSQRGTIEAKERRKTPGDRQHGNRGYLCNDSLTRKAQLGITPSPSAPSTPLSFGGSRSFLGGGDDCFHGNQGKTALHISAERGNLGIVRFLLEHGVDIDVADGRGRTALHYAARGGHVNVVEKLLGEGADPEAWDYEGRSPLHAAADADCEAIIGLLTREGADLNAAIGVGGGESAVDDGEDIIGMIET